MARSSIRTSENIAKLVKLTATTVQLPASRLNIGALQYRTVALTLDKSITGLGGCDVAVAAGSLYYVYAVVSSNVVYLIASLSSSLPSGFTQARKVGAFTTGTTSQILEAFYYGQGAVVGEPQSVTITGSWTTNTTYTATETRVGSWATYIIKVALSGTPNASNLEINLPAGRTINTAVLNTNNEGGNLLPLSTVGINDTTVKGYVGGVYYRSSTQVGVAVVGAGSTYGEILSVSQVSPIAFGNSDYIQISLTVPIAGWAGSGTQFVW